jgi:IclR family KDG regulon transcriptional repressor
MTSPNQTILRAAALVDLLAKEGEELGAREIARRAGLTRSTAHRLLVSLELVGLVEQAPLTDKYRLGYKAGFWASRSSHQSGLHEKALPHMARLRDHTQETVGLSVRVRGGRTYLAQVESRHDIRWTMETGRLLPLHAGAPGKLLLASLPDAEVEAVLRRLPPRRLTPATPIGRGQILAAVRKIRRDGVAVGLGEIVDGSATIAAPVRDARGEVVAALSVSGPSFRFTEARRAAAVPALRAAAADLSRELGHGGDAGLAEAAPRAPAGRRAPPPRRRSGAR